MAEQRRALLPFLQRAEEVQKVEPKIAYYCRLYAVEEGMKLENRDKAVDELLFSVMDKLEAFKSKNTLNAEEDKLHLEGFALKIFDRADRVDRAGRSDMSTCKMFYAASVFMEVCTQFGDLDEDLLGKQKYAAWKAADIRKAIREGRKPTPPPQDPAPTQPDAFAPSELPTPPEAPSQPASSIRDSMAATQASAPAPSPKAAPAPAPAPAKTRGSKESGPSLMQMHEAQRQAKVAVSSLGFQDHKSAIEYLQKALDILTQK